MALMLGIPGIGGGMQTNFLQMLTGGLNLGGNAGIPTFGFDGFNASNELFERGGGSVPSFMLGNQFGFGGGQALPGMSFGGGFPMGGLGGFPMGGNGSPFSMGGANQQTAMMAMMMRMMMMMMQQMGQQQGGFGGQNPLQMGGPGCMGGPGGPGGFGGGGGAHELQKGQSYTTRGGATINWQGDEVQVHDPNGSNQQLGGAGGGGRSFAYSGTTPDGRSIALAGAISGPGGQQCQQGQGGAQDWKVWGDPHIKNPNGQQTDYNRNGGLFTLSDGTRVEIEADGPNQVTKRVMIFDAGAQLGGFDANNTTDYGRANNGQFQDHGSVAQTMGNAGFTSPFGNNMMAGNFGNFGQFFA
jgi:hypothetical protein